MRDWGRKLWQRVLGRAIALPMEPRVEVRRDRLRELASEMQGLQQVAIRRLHIVPVPPGKGIGSTQKLTLLAEFGRLGFHIVNPEALDEASPELFLDYAAIIATLVEIRGGAVSYAPLCPGFPPRSFDTSADFNDRLAAYQAETRSRMLATDPLALRIIPAEQAVASLRAWVADSGQAGEEGPEDLQRDRELVRKLLGTLTQRDPTVAFVRTRRERSPFDRLDFQKESCGVACQEA